MMTSTIIENVTMIMETAVVVMCKFSFALNALATRQLVSNNLYITITFQNIDQQYVFDRVQIF